MYVEYKIHQSNFQNNTYLTAIKYQPKLKNLKTKKYIRNQNGFRFKIVYLFSY